jgi:hypothetical protein
VVGDTRVDHVTAEGGSDPSNAAPQIFWDARIWDASTRQVFNSGSLRKYRKKSIMSIGVIRGEYSLVFWDANSSTFLTADHIERQIKAIQKICSSAPSATKTILGRKEKNGSLISCEGFGTRGF